MDGTITVAVADLVNVAVGGGQFLAAATDAAPTPTPWHESQLLGVVAGALLGGLGSWLLAAHASRAAAREAATVRAADRVELRRDSRKAASQAFLVEVRKLYDFSRRFEEENDTRYGDVDPQSYGQMYLVEETLADLALEVPDEVYAVAVRLRDVLYIHVWVWDAVTKKTARATDKDVEAADGDLRRAVRDLLANN
jgi:hypothetical protein